MKKTKVCRRCKRELPLESFRKSKAGGQFGTCTECVKIRNREAVEELKERDSRSKRVASHGVLPTRRCAGLPGRPCLVKTWDHRCPKCLRAWRAMNHITASAEEEATYDAILA